MVKAFLRKSLCIVGLVGFGIILGEVLKKWQLADPDFSLVWIVTPILVLFAIREITRSDYIRQKRSSPPIRANIDDYIECCLCPAFDPGVPRDCLSLVRHPRGTGEKGGAVGVRSGRVPLRDQGDCREGNHQDPGSRVVSLPDTLLPSGCAHLSTGKAVAEAINIGGTNHADRYPFSSDLYLQPGM